MDISHDTSHQCSTVPEICVFNYSNTLQQKLRISGWFLLLFFFLSCWIRADAPKLRDYKNWKGLKGGKKKSGLNMALVHQSPQCHLSRGAALLPKLGRCCGMGLICMSLALAVQAAYLETNNFFLTKPKCVLLPGQMLCMQKTGGVGIVPHWSDALVVSTSSWVRVQALAAWWGRKLWCRCQRTHLDFKHWPEFRLFFRN